MFAECMCGVAVALARLIQLVRIQIVTQATTMANENDSQQLKYLVFILGGQKLEEGSFTQPLLKKAGSCCQKVDPIPNSVINRQDYRLFLTKNY